jgi:pyruvate/2-oxoglutarate dehydrogenase complex dihydrolipoamide acyltransferase (E2) component
MKRFLLPALMILCLATALSLAQSSNAQTPPPSTSTQAPSGHKTLAATLNVYAFPQKGQTAEQQSIDESDCYQWAVTNSGSDPFQVSKQAEAQKQQAQQAQQQAQQATQQQMDNFKKAFSACLEGKNYMVKY